MVDYTCNIPDTQGKHRRSKWVTEYGKLCFYFVAAKATPPPPVEGAQKRSEYIAIDSVSCSAFLNDVLFYFFFLRRELLVLNTERSDDVLHARYSCQSVHVAIMSTADVTATSAINAASLHLVCVDLEQQLVVQSAQESVRLRLQVSQLHRQHPRLLRPEGEAFTSCLPLCTHTYTLRLVVTTTIRLRFDGRSTVYQRVIKVTVT